MRYGTGDLDARKAQRMIPQLRAGSTLALAMLIVSLVQAQDDGPPAGERVYKLALKPSSDIASGKVAVVEGVAAAAEQHLAVGDLSVLQPVRVILTTPAADSDVRITLSKFTLDEPAVSGSTAGAGVAAFQFRTQGDLQIRVTAPSQPTPYKLLVWAGDEVPAPMTSPFVSMDDYKRKNAAVPGSAAGPAASNSLVLWVIGGSLVVIAGLLAVMVLKRGRS
jgi:hypothetical protein